MGDNDEFRPDSSWMLHTHRGDDNRKGRLRVFLGMVAGCGKTYAMLKAAEKALADGVDIVAGYIETHGRKDIESLAASVPSIPRKKVVYRGIVLEELDLDAVISRRPSIVLVDELAHTNVPESRHPKRYQDVLDILDAGIDVFTTLNIQHLESRAGTVREITGVTIKETIPDSVIDLADSVELIDISPDELRKRLKEGKIHPPDRDTLAEKNFFETGNLTALREMALRFTAEKVAHSLQNYRRTRKIWEAWKTGERLLVAVSPSPFSESLIRWTRRMAYSLGANWIAVNVETPRSMSRDDQQRLQKHISLARSLGAEIVVTQDDDVTRGILRIARQRNITQIVAGKPGDFRWRDFFRPRSPVRRLIKESGNIDIYVIRAEEREKNIIDALSKPFSKISGLRHYAVSSSVLAVVTLANYFALPYIGPRSVALILLFSVMIMALFVSRGAVFVYAAISALLWNFLFLPPVLTFYIHRLEDAIMFLMYFVIAVVTGSLTARIRSQEKSTRHREEQLNVLYGMTKHFISSKGTDRAVEHVVSFMRETFNAETVIYLMTESEQLSALPHPASTIHPDEKEFACARYAYLNKKNTGRFTDTLPSSELMCIPLFFNRENILGVMGIRFPDEAVVTVQHMSLIETLSGQLALVIERDLMTQRAQHTRVIEESEKLYRVLLNSVTHELRTPLAAIKGSISIMKDPGVARNPEALVRLIHDAQSASERLIKLVDNLLDMGRLESGKIQLNLDWNDISDLIGVVLGRLGDSMMGHTVTVDCPENMPLARFDFNLVAQMLYNIVHNAITHTKEGTSVSILVSRTDTAIQIAVEDNGCGIPDGERERLFDKFYRINKKDGGGLGLGLSIAKGIIELHGGTITAGASMAGGARFVILLPVELSDRPILDTK